MSIDWTLSYTQMVICTENTVWRYNLKKSQAQAQREASSFQLQFLQLYFLNPLEDSLLY